MYEVNRGIDVIDGKVVGVGERTALWRFLLLGQPYLHATASVPRHPNMCSSKPTTLIPIPSQCISPWNGEVIFIQRREPLGVLIATRRYSNR